MDWATPGLGDELVCFDHSGNGGRRDWPDGSVLQGTKGGALAGQAGLVFQFQAHLLADGGIGLGRSLGDLPEGGLRVGRDHIGPEVGRRSDHLGWTHGLDVVPGGLIRVEVGIDFGFGGRAFLDADGQGQGLRTLDDLLLLSQLLLADN